jgi:hypothetical protein
MKSKICSFIVILLITSLFVFSEVTVFAQKGGNLKDCKQWFFKTIQELPKQKNTFATSHFALPFLSGLSSDAHYSYEKISDPQELAASVEIFFTKCLRDYKKKSKVTFKEVVANEETLANLNIRNEDQYDENGDLVPQSNEIPYEGLISAGDQVFVISSSCGPVYKIYDLPLTTSLYVIYNQAEKKYKFWAAVIGF